MELIDRQAAINVVCKDCEYYYNENLIQSLKDLPSVQPETHDKRTETHSCVSIIRCKDCKHYVDGYIHCNRVTWWNGEDDFCSRAERKEQP